MHPGELRGSDCVTGAGVIGVKGGTASHSSYEEDESLEGFENFNKDNAEGDSTWDLQSGHGTRMAGMIYARLLSEGGFESKSQKNRFQRVSQEWHQFGGFNSSHTGFGISIGQEGQRSHYGYECVASTIQLKSHSKRMP
jgi:hypothetical protein